MSSRPVIGIDLGTTNSVAGFADESGVRILAGQDEVQLIPSIVSFHPSGEVLVGTRAKDRRLLDAENTVYSIKRLIGRPYTSYEVQQAMQRFAFELLEGPSSGVMVTARGETYTLSEISAFVLGHVRKIAEEALGRPVEHAVVTVPANFNELQRSATKAAGRVAGLDVLRILNEPTAAALAYGYGRSSSERVAIYDLGGGTFDLTILQLAGDVFEVLATAGDTFLGGDDVDTLVADDMASKFLERHRYDVHQDRQAYERLRAAAEWAKCQLSKKGEVKLCIEELAYGEGGAGLDLEYRLSRQRLEQVCQPLVARSFDVCEDAMKAAGLRPTQLDNVILVGGSTRIPLLQRMVAEYFGRKPQVTIDPDLVVAQGAALQARALATPARAALGKVSLKKVPQTGAHPVVRPGFDESFDEEVTSIADRPIIPPPVSGAARRKATMIGHGPPPPPPTVGRPAVARKPDASALEDTPTRTEELAGVLEQPTVTATAAEPLDDVPTGSSVAIDPLEDAHTSTGMGPESLEDGGTVTAVDVDPFEDEPTRAGEASGLMMELGEDAFSPRSGAPAPRRAPGPPTFPKQADDTAEFEEIPTASGDLPTPQAGAPPLLLDVTPLSLGVETVDGYCEHIIRRNSAIPAEQTKMFTTARDNQSAVSVRICQGEARQISRNQELGKVVLEGIRPAARGKVQISVTFVIDADGTLQVRAKDIETGKEQQISVKLIGEVPEGDLEALRQRHEAKVGS